ncbi:MAG: S6e family ribosomal protein [Candidatus Diapherotrites archaeon]
MQIVLSDPKSKKAYSKKVEGVGGFSGKKIGQTVKLDEFGLAGFEGRISGGSDKTGTPMRFDLPGTQRKRIYMAGPPGFKPERKGERIKKAVRGNTIADDIAQVNVVVTKTGTPSLDEIFPKTEKVEEKSLKEKMIEESHEVAASMSAEEAHKIKGKIKK